ncbi:Tripartite tricarboxylate transporter TctB family protein [Tranquillimonas rosea]|uniref:Tripartite tricarboxylate transporter TctB family protein n=1 Tax=Tranquillimonas rosea TaxID=641238 RepID=A0A1H9WUU1_9RHOB|nr:tripartite tricarboxylate transporter TctB family protein [Tranquillimonas rosea]SES37702.1 Tripartite tricarboxylate transporter TctB family protein [Tranquillimonas rosea]
MRLTRAARLLAPVCLIGVFAAIAFGWTLTFENVPPMLVRSFQPSAFPQLVCGLIVALSILAGYNTVRHDDADNLDGIPRQFYLTIGVLIIASLVAMTLDFLLAMMVGAAGIAAAWGERRASILIGVGLVGPVLTFLLFNEALQIRFPRGVLLNIYYGW